MVAGGATNNGDHAGSRAPTRSRPLFRYAPLSVSGAFPRRCFWLCIGALRVEFGQSRPRSTHCSPAALCCACLPPLRTCAAGARPSLISTASPPAEKATASQDQAAQPSTGDGAGDGNRGRLNSSRQRRAESRARSIALVNNFGRARKLFQHVFPHLRISNSISCLLPEHTHAFSFVYISVLVLKPR